LSGELWWTYTLAISTPTTTKQNWSLTTDLARSRRSPVIFAWPFADEGGHPGMDEFFNALLGGVDQGTANVVTLGTTAAAAALWRRVRSQLRRKQGSLDTDEMAALAAEPGQLVDAQALRSLLQRLPEEELRAGLTVYETHVAGDWVTDRGVKNVFNFGGGPTVQ
jgi:hypothetical protein